MPNRYIVTGSDSSGQAVKKLVEADSLAAAEAVVAQTGIAVTAVRLQTDTAPTAPVASSSPAIADADAAIPGSEETLWTGTPSLWPLWGYFVLEALAWAAFIAGFILFPNHRQPVAIGTASFAGLCSLVLVFKVLKQLSKRITLTSQRLKVSTGILSKDEEQVELYRVRDYSVTQTLGQRIASIGTLTLTTTDSVTPVIRIENIPSPHNLRELVRQHTERVRRVQRVREVELS